MQTHDDRDANPEIAKFFMEALEKRAENMKGMSEITAGKAEEIALDQWSAHSFAVTVRPDDPQGILRISVGGGDTPVNLNYCVVRGDVEKCIELLENAIKALRR